MAAIAITSNASTSVNAGRALCTGVARDWLKTGCENRPMFGVKGGEAKVVQRLKNRRGGNPHVNQIPASPAAPYATFLPRFASPHEKL